LHLVRRCHTGNVRVLLVSHGFPPDGIAGVERYAEGLAHELALAGDTVAVATARPGRGNCELVREKARDAVPVYRLTRPKIPAERLLRHSRALERDFATVLDEFAPDVVHVNHLIGLSPRFLEQAHARGSAVVLSLWDYYFVCSRYQLTKTSGAPCSGPRGGRECARTCFATEGAVAASRWKARTDYFATLLQTAERVISPSAHVAAYFRPLLLDPDRLRLLPLGLPGSLPAAARARRTSRRAPLELAVLGYVFPNKGAHVVVAALERAALPAARLTLHGKVVDAAYATALERQAEAIPNVDLVVAGPYEREALPKLLEDADCVIVPSRWPETFAFVAREALAVGLPVIAARIGALPEAIVEGENGLTFGHDDPVELAALLRRLDEDRALLSRLRAGARRTSPLSAAAHAEAVRGTYAEAIEEFAQDGAMRDRDRRELHRLERRLVELGFGGRRR
jgi:glycosyltransferase involved in cell wall biosynthesis